MATTFELIASATTGGSSANSLSFTGIPASYTDLCLKISGRLASNDNYYSIKFNGASTTVGVRTIRGNGSGTDSENWSGNYIAISEPNNYTANVYASTEFYIPNYAGSTNKVFNVKSVNENNSTSAFCQLASGLWSNTAAITQIDIGNITGASDLAAYTNAYLYGVKNA